jgi:uncharacterized membrane protein YgcG
MPEENYSGLATLLRMDDSCIPKKVTVCFSGKSPIPCLQEDGVMLLEVYQRISPDMTLECSSKKDSRCKEITKTMDIKQDDDDDDDDDDDGGGGGGSGGGGGGGRSGGGGGGGGGGEGVSMY